MAQLGRTGKQNPLQTGATRRDQVRAAVTNPVLIGAAQWPTVHCAAIRGGPHRQPESQRCGCGALERKNRRVEEMGLLGLLSG